MTRKFDRYMVVVGAGRNRKFARLTDSERCAHFLGVLSVAAQSPRRGYLLVTDGEEAGPEEIASEAGVTVKVAESTMSKLMRVGVLKRDDDVGAWFVHDWNDVNPSPGAERTRRWRDASGDVSGDGAVTNGRHTNVTETSPEVRSKKERAKALSSDADRAEEKATEDDVRLCRLLGELAKARNPKFKVKSKSRWLTDMRLLRERDGNDPAEIEAAIRWAFTDTGRDAQFWADVLQSPSNLREHFPQVWAKMKAAPHLRAVPVEDSAAFLARRGVA